MNDNDLISVINDMPMLDDDAGLHISDDVGLELAYPDWDELTKLMSEPKSVTVFGEAGNGKAFDTPEGGRNHEI